MAEEQEFEAETPVGKFRARGYDLLTAVVVAALVAVGYMLWMHMQEAKVANSEIANAIRDGVRAQRLTACIIATPEPLREAQYSMPQSLCNRIAQ